MSTISLSTASTLAFTDAALPMGTAPTDGQVLVRSGSTITGAAAASGLPSTGGTGIVAQTAASTTAARTITGTANRVTVSNGDGVAGNPTLDVGSNVYVAGGTDVAVADGGTGASTVTGARDNIVYASSGVVNPASPYTVAAGVNRVTLNASGTVVLPALSSYADVQPIVVINGTAAAITVTLDPDGTETIDSGGAGASAAYTVAARGSVGAVRLSATAWGSVQSGSVGVTGARCYLSGGVWYAVGIGTSSTGEVDVGAPVAMTAVAGGGGVTLATNELTIASGTAATTKVDPTTIGAAGQVWYVALSSLGLSTAIATTYSVTTEAVGSRPTVEDAYVVGWAASGVPSTSSQVVQGSGPCYSATGKTFVYAYSTNNTAETAANASNDVMISSGVVGDNAGQAVSFNTARSTKGLTASTTPTVSVITHLCITAGVRGSALGSDAVFGDVRVTLRKAAV